MSENRIFIAGIDDATKCPVIGSIFIAGVMADEAKIEEWKKIGVKDSKLIAPKKRDQLAEIIKKNAIAYVIAQITPAMIDDKSFNLNEWEMLVVLKIMNKLIKKNYPHSVYIDNWETTARGFSQRFNHLMRYSIRKQLAEKKIRFNRKNLRKLNLVAEHYADENYTIVGAASILAKTSSDAQYRAYKKKYGDFGSGNPGDPKTRLFVWQHRQNPLPIIRTSWNTFKTLSSLSSIEEDYLCARKMRLCNVDGS